MIWGTELPLVRQALTPFRHLGCRSVTFGWSYVTDGLYPTRWTPLRRIRACGRLLEVSNGKASSPVLDHQ